MRVPPACRICRLCDVEAETRSIRQSATELVAARTLHAFRFPGKTFAVREPRAASDPRSVLGGGLLGVPVQERLDEPVDVAIEDPVRIASLMAGAKILDHAIGLEDIRANLVAP
jgi:hypothetical protein